MTLSAIEIQKRIDAHNRYVEEHGRYEPIPASTAKVKPPRPRKGKEPTLAAAIAAGTKVMLVPSFVADAVAILETEDVDAWVRASLIRETSARRSIGGQLKDPRDPAGRWMSHREWCIAKASIGKRRLRYVQGLTPAQLIALTEDPDDTRRMVDEMLAAVRHCIEAQRSALATAS